MTTTVGADLRERLRPSDTQVAVAVAMLQEVPASEATHVVVPIALPGKQRGIWIEGQQVQPVNGFWLANRDNWEGPYAGARGHAEDAARLWLVDQKLSGVSAYACIDRDGTWAVFEGLLAQSPAASRQTAGRSGC